MAQTKIKAGLFEGIIGNGTDGYYLMSNGDGTMTWSSIIVNPNITNVAYPGSATAANPAGDETITLTGTGFQSGATVTVGGTTATTVSYISETQITFTTPPKSPGDYDIAITNTDTGSTTYINGISYNGIPSWTTPTGSLGTFASDETISTITLQAAEPDAGTITFNITSGALPTGLSLTGADIDGTTSIENADTTYNFTVTATDDESQSTGRSFSITVEKYIVQPLENFTINTYTGNGSTQSIEGKIGTAASFNGSNSYIANAADIGYNNSVSMWFWPKPSGAGGLPLFGRENGGGLEWGVCSLYYDGTDYNLNMQLRNSSYLYQAYQNFTLTDDWHHIVFTFDSNSGFTAYIDNSEVTLTTTNSSGTVSFPGGTSSIGSQYGNGDPRQYFNGLIDQVRVFNKKLSTAEVATLYNENDTSTTKSTTDIFDDGSGVALYEFEEGTKDTGGVNGYVNGGAIFNGSNSYIHYPDSLINKTSSSISFWLYSKGANAASNDQYVFLYNNSSTGAEFPIILRNNGTSLDFTFGTTPRKTLNLNEWYNVIINFKSNNTQDIYIDGVLLGSTSHTSSMSGTKIWTMGRYNRSGLEGSYLNAGIDEFRIYSTNLSTNDIGYIANNDTANIPTANLTSYYKFDGNAVDEQLNNTATPTNVIFNYNGTPTNVGFVGTSFQPDLVWFKNRIGTNSHALVDSVRGRDKYIFSDLTLAEPASSAAGQDLVSFDSNGFTLGAVNNAGSTNVNNGSIVAWCWKAGGSAVSNTDGTITSQVSANTEAGFSIVKYNTGTTHPHTVGTGLSQAPEMIISKVTNVTAAWPVFHKDLTNPGQSYLLLDSTDDATDYGSDLWNYSNWSNNKIGGQQVMFGSDNDVISYCFHSVDGYQKVGSYSGGSTNTISTGFKPRFIIVKRTNRDGDDWHLFDSTREGDDSTDKMLKPNTSDSEGNGGADRTVNFTSDGFNWTNANSNAVNASGGQYIYLAIA